MSNPGQGFRVGAPNAENLARRRLQLQEWQASDTNNLNLATLTKKNLIQFKRKFMFLDSVIQQDADEVQRLLALGVDVNYTNTDGISALHQVCIDGNAEIAEILLRAGPNINAPDNDGWTPLHAAAQCGYTDLARLLLEAGADIACVDNEGHLPLDKAEEDDMRQLLATWMRKKAIDIDQVRTAEERAIREASDRVIRSRVKELDVVTADGATILHCAAAKGIPDVITLLARAGISMDIQDKDGWTPLHAAAKWAQPEAIEALIDNGADIHIVNTFAETPLDIADEDVLDMLKEYYDRNPARSKPLVPGVERFIRPTLPDRSEVNSIMKGSRRARENKENRPEKLPRTEEPPKKKEEPVNDVAKSRRDPVASTVDKPGPAVPAWQARKTDNDVSSVRNKRVLAPDTLVSTPPKKLEPEQPSKRPSIPTINTEDSTSDKPEVVRKAVSRRKREERRPTQAVTADDIPSAPPKEEEKKKEDAPKQLAPPTLVVPTLPNGPSTPSTTDDKKPRHVPVTVSISDSGAVVWDNNKKSPENETPSPVNNESASDKAEIVRKKVARKKRDERRSTQHVSKDDLPATPDKAPANNKPSAPETSTTNNKEKEDHLAKELELERKRYNESAEALARNQEDLRKREVKIASLEKENEAMKKKMADLEEDLRRLQQVNSDNQRLRDENAALIRVIGKLSRNPL
ncbi:hypothetical protein ACHWQZ_G010677 [Mnemiopsis leidyi]